MEWSNQSPNPTSLVQWHDPQFRHLKFKGAIWYQGESNRGEGMLYHEKMKALFKAGELYSKTLTCLSILFNSLPILTGSELALPEIWEAQGQPPLPNTGMAVTTDISNLKDIHPKNKQDVGLRLALWALAKTYGKEDLLYSDLSTKAIKYWGDHRDLFSPYCWKSGFE